LTNGNESVYSLAQTITERELRWRAPCFRNIFYVITCKD